MTIKELMGLLEDTKSKLEQKGINDEAKLDLEILIIQTKRQIILGAWNTLKDLDEVTVVDTSKLKTLTGQLSQDIDKEEKRISLINNIIHIAKSALKGAGMPIPS